MKKLVVVLLVVILYTGLALPSQMDTVTGEHGYFVLQENAPSTCFLYVNTASRELAFYEMSLASDTLYTFNKVKEFNKLVCEKVTVIRQTQNDSYPSGKFQWMPATGEVGNTIRNLIKGWIENGVWFQLLLF